MDMKAVFIKSDENLGSLIDTIAKEQWNQPTPDTEWSVRDLVNHLVGEELWLPELLAGKTIAEVGTKYDGDVLGDDAKATWDKASQAARASVEALSDLEQIVHLSFGDVPASDYIGQMIIDRVIHAWDLAKGIDADPKISEDLAGAAYEILEPQAEDWRKGGAFGPKIEVPDSADTLSKLLAISGREA